MSCIDNTNNKYVATLYFEGYTDTEVFKSYTKQILIPELKQIKKIKLKNKELKNRRERLTVILDNASFHKGKDIEELFEKSRINLIYLPPYSPDLNPIEHKWAQLKSKIRKYRDMWMFDMGNRMKNMIKLVDMLLKLGSKN